MNTLNLVLIGKFDECEIKQQLNINDNSKWPFKLRISNTSNRISSKLKGNETYLLFDNAIYAINYIELTNYIFQNILMLYSLLFIFQHATVDISENILMA